MRRWLLLLGCLAAVPALFVAHRSPDPEHFGVSLAASTVAGWRPHDPPHLIIRCQERRTEAYVVIGVSAQPEPGHVGRHTVRLRFDDRQQEPEVWDQSVDDKALFSRDPIRFVKRVARSKTLTFEFTPFQHGPVMATFPVTGFSKRLPALQRCVEGDPDPLPFTSRGFSHAASRSNGSLKD